MADTPRVTVPVEQEFAHYRRSQIAHLRPYVAGETLSDRVSISSSDLEAGSPKPGDMIARNPANHDDQWLVAADYFAANFEPISAAPAPEGEEVDGPGGYLVKDFADGWYWTPNADLDHASGAPVWSVADNRYETDPPALAAREEAPAEAGELVWFDVRDVPQDGTSILLNHRTHGIIQGWFSKGEWSDDTPISPREYSGDMWILGDDLYQDEVEFGEGGMVLPSGVLGWLPLSALRAQPPAREDAQPVAWPEELTPEMENVWRSAFISQGHLRRNADGRVKHPDSCERAAYRALRRFVAKNHPAPDALRVAVEALEKISNRRSIVFGRGEMSGQEAFGIATQALAALQAEQKGGA